MSHVAIIFFYHIEKGNSLLSLPIMKVLFFQVKVNYMIC